MWTPPTLFSWVWLFVMTKALFPILVPDVSTCGSSTSQFWRLQWSPENPESIELLERQGIDFDKGGYWELTLPTLLHWFWNLGCWAITLLSLGLPFMVPMTLPTWWKSWFGNHCRMIWWGLWTWCSASLEKDFSIWSIWWSFAMALWGFRESG